MNSYKLLKSVKFALIILFFQAVIYSEDHIKSAQLEQWFKDGEKAVNDSTPKESVEERPLKADVLLKKQPSVSNLPFFGVYVICELIS